MTDFIIIGGGISGLVTARELALAGARVTIIEQGSLASESSWAGGGILSPLYPWNYADAVIKLSRWSQKQYGNLVAQLFESTSIDPELLVSGLLIADLPADDAAEKWCAENNTLFEKLSLAEAENIAPGLQPSSQELLWLPDIAQVRNPCLLNALRADLEKRGVHFIENNPVSKIVTDGQRVTGLRTEHGLFAADNYILCAGAWSQQLWPDREGLQVKPVKGQIILYKTEPGLLSKMLLDNGRYLIPRKDGHILVGSTVEQSGFDKSTSTEALDSLRRFAVERFPALNDYPVVKQWAGLRPGTDKGIPYIGKHPRFNNLSANCGHFRNGFVMAPAAAHLLVDILLGRKPIVPVEPYLIGGE